MEVNGDENGLNRGNAPPARERRNQPPEEPQEMELEQEIQDEDMPFVPDVPQRRTRVRNPVVEIVLEVHPNRVHEEEPRARKRRKLQRESRRGRIMRRERLGNNRGTSRDAAVPGPSGLPPPRITRLQSSRSRRRHSSSESD